MADPSTSEVAFNRLIDSVLAAVSFGGTYLVTSALVDMRVPIAAALPIGAFCVCYLQHVVIDAIFSGDDDE